MMGKTNLRLYAFWMFIFMLVAGVGFTYATGDWQAGVTAAGLVFYVAFVSVEFLYKED